MRLKGATIPDRIVERVIARRGAEHCFADLDPARTALVVIDLQHAFMNDAVGHAVCPAARDIVPAVNRLAAALRETGGGVFWVQMTHDARCLEEWSVAHQMVSPAMREKRVAALSEGGLGHQLWPDLEIRPEDEIVKKYRYSAFMPGTSDLPDRLRARGFRHGADHRHGHQCVLRKLGPRRQHDQLSHDHGQRRQRGEHPAGARRLAQRLLQHLRRCHGHRYDHRQSAAGALGTSRLTRLAFDERQQVGIDRVRFGGRHAVREALVGFQGRVLQQLMG